MNNILVVNINWLGDAVFSTPVFKALKKQYPQARISCLCVPRVADVLKYCADIDDLIIYDERGKHRYPWKKIGIINNMRMKKFDAVFLLHRSMTRALMMFLAGIPVRVGYANSKGKNFLTHAYQVDIENCHRKDAYLGLIKSFGINVDGIACQLTPKFEDIKAMAGLLEQDRIAPKSFYVFNIGGNWDLKRWPLECWKQLLMTVDKPVVFTGSNKDEADINSIISFAKTKAVSLAGKTSLGQSLAVYQLSYAVVSADSGPLHLAQSVGASIVGLFGPTRPEITGPVGVGPSQILFNGVGCNKTPCYHLSCTDHECMKSIKVNDVYQALSAIAS